MRDYWRAWPALGRTSCTLGLAILQPTVLQADGEGTIYKEIALLEYGTSPTLENGMWNGFKAQSDQLASLRLIDDEVVEMILEGDLAN
jgi:hypothetical protein